MNYLKAAALLIIVLLMVLGCSSLRSPGSNNYSNISSAVAKLRLANGEEIILLDVRTLEENRAERIPGSILIPVDDLEREAAAQLQDKNTPIFIYCRSGRRSVTAAVALVKLGYTDVYNLGGIKDWPYETESEE